MQKNISIPLAIFWEITKLLKQQLKSPFSFATLLHTTAYTVHTTIYMRIWMKLKPTYVEYLGPHDFGKVSFVKFGPANQEFIGDICRVSNCLFFVRSYILVLR